MLSPDESLPPTKGLFPRLKLRVWLAEVFHPNELQTTLFWAGVIGFAGAVVSVGFRRLSEWVHWALTQHDGGYVESFTHLAAWQRLITPAIGGLLAGLTLWLGVRWTRKKSTTDYMEAIVLGDGVLAARSSIVKCGSALFSIASGGSIGREGPLVLLSAVIASLIGRLRRTPTLQLRLLVACGAAAGIASAYNAPIGGALFVAEIVLRSLAMETFGPLVFASVIATLTVRQFLGESPLYEMPATRLGSSWEILPHLVVGIVAGAAAPWFLRLLRSSEKAFLKLQAPVYLRLALGGLIVGALAIWHPEVCGNGYTVVNQLLHGHWFWRTLVVILALKLVATAATFGSGAVGGVFTPTLFVGACLGSLVWQMAQAVWPGPPLSPTAFVVVGMGALLSATTHAPVMAIIMLFEMTLDYEIILPLMLACVVAHYVSMAFQPDSIYAESLKRKGAGQFKERLAGLRVGDLMKKNPLCVGENASFTEIAESFLLNRFNYLYIVGSAGDFLGVISLHDIKSYLSQRDLADLVIARDIMREGFPTVTPDESVSVALDRFAQQESERLPVTESVENRRLIGSISKTDLILALAERTKAASSPTAPTAPAAA